MLEKNRNFKKKTNELPIINERIPFPEIRLIDVQGTQVGILSIQDALQSARNAGLDLVLISNKSNPPVCRIVDYGKYKFNQEKKAKEARKKQHNSTLKEVKMRYKIEEHDYQVRISQALRFLQSSDKVKATITFRGREIQHANLAIELLQKMAKDLEAVAEIQQAPSRDGKNMVMILTPKK
uniref:Translation initiation factor IF-3, chloroplastic n=1 Tax=Helminthocladia australis TaxID=260093 RepID=A0A1G4NTE1_9FLOR|nr:Translation initiation factor 3 [Helminthocladia australis]SCW21930.1 Translation initiation factor 3 [Helminthocladia australis]